MTFWATKSLDELDATEWEALCDGCGKCCLHKLQDEDDDTIHYTDIACRVFDAATCRCRDYSQRQRIDMCIHLRELPRVNFSWLPASCAYRLRSEGKSLPQWHPLISGSDSSVHEAGISMQHKVVNEEYVHPDEWQERVIQWV